VGGWGGWLFVGLGSWSITLISAQFLRLGDDVAWGSPFAWIYSYFVSRSWKFPRIRRCAPTVAAVRLRGGVGGWWGGVGGVLVWVVWCFVLGFCWVVLLFFDSKMLGVWCGFSPRVDGGDCTCSGFFSWVGASNRIYGEVTHTRRGSRSSCLATVDARRARRGSAATVAGTS